MYILLHMVQRATSDDAAYMVLFALVSLLLSFFILGVKVYSHVPFNDMWCKLICLTVVVGFPLYAFLRISKKVGVLAIMMMPFVQLALMPVIC